MDKLRGRRPTFKSQPLLPARPERETYKPDSEWIEDQDKWTLLVLLPGFKRDEIKVQLDSAMKLIVKGSRKAPSNTYIDVNESFDVPKDVIAEQISGRFEDGRLNLTMPRRMAKEEEVPPKAVAEEKVEEPVPEAEKKKEEETLQKEKKSEEEKKEEPTTEMPAKEEEQKQPERKEELAAEKPAKEEEKQPERKEEPAPHKPAKEEEKQPHEAMREEKPTTTEEKKDEPTLKEKPTTETEKKDTSHAIQEKDVEDGKKDAGAVPPQQLEKVEVKKAEAVEKEKLDSIEEKKGDSTSPEMATSGAMEEKEEKIIEKMKSKIREICSDTPKEIRKRISAWRGIEDGWSDSATLDGIVEKLNSNRKVIAVAVVAFSLGVIVSRKLCKRA